LIRISLQLPKSLGTIFYEIELGVVIGKKGKSIKKSEVLDYVSGYFLTLDMTAKEFLVGLSFNLPHHYLNPWNISTYIKIPYPSYYFVFLTRLKLCSIVEKISESKQAMGNRKRFRHSMSREPLHP
jgi:hypothetical protein